jgi:putative transposase
MKMVVNGVSPWKIRPVTEEYNGTECSKSTMSELAFFIVEALGAEDPRAGALRSRRGCVVTGIHATGSGTFGGRSATTHSSRRGAGQ